MKFRSSPSSRGRLSARYISALCLLVTGIYGQTIGPESSGIDAGNIFCTGTCVSSLDELSCRTPTLPMFRPAKDCYACCYSDDHAGDWADNMREDS
ncbi:hypothetical protein BDV28DRAFT_152217 [Aspergillus coremiiformis]|uniref:Uncharacterized protein n=1 Tax=Aspergillus coremiiformis TaxID=138285 RepID=A0A5N6YUH5_9EURO|nr:hypothetical protein BDV28DRAFT_152217 [Aspergillus coremiiformis]